MTSWCTIYKRLFVHNSFLWYIFEFLVHLSCRANCSHNYQNFRLFRCCKNLQTVTSFPRLKLELANSLEVIRYSFIMSLPTFTSKWTNCFTLIVTFGISSYGTIFKGLSDRGTKLKRSTYNKPPSSWDLNLHISKAYFSIHSEKSLQKPSQLGVVTCVQLWLKKAVVPNNNRAKPKKKILLTDFFMKSRLKKRLQKRLPRIEVPSKAQKEL